MFEVAFRTCDCRRVCLILSASCSSSTVAEAVKLLRIVARFSKILRKNWSILEARKTLLKLQEVYWKETIRDAQTGHSIKQAAKKGIKEESLVIVC